MTEKEEIEILKAYRDKLSNSVSNQLGKDIMAFDTAIKALRDIKEIAEVISCDADAETKCEMIFNIFTAKPHYFEI